MSSSLADNAPRKHFALHGPERAFDPRVTAYRGDLADIALAGHLFAPHYAEPMARRCIMPSAMLYGQPDRRKPAVSQLLHGEPFQVLDIAGDWAWGYCEADHYVGYVTYSALGDTPAPTHQVTARAALIFAEADLKSQCTARLPMGAALHCAAPVDGTRFLACEGGFVATHHVGTLGAASEDIATLALRCLGTPYLWGGRNGDGIDCSGLLQMVLALKGIAAPRDSDQQAAALGEEIADQEALQRGDLIFFADHVGIMAGESQLIHANAWWMQTVCEPLADVLARAVDSAPLDIIARRRLVL